MPRLSASSSVRRPGAAGTRRMAALCCLAVLTAIPLAAGEQAAQVSAGGGFSLALLRNGTVRAWGSNSVGQTAVPSGLGDAVAVAAGSSHSLALLRDGTVRSWGSLTDVPAGLAGAVQVSAGFGASYALLADGSVRGWGPEMRASLDALAPAKQISAGDFHVLSVRTDGSIAGAGADDYGQATPPAGLGRAVQVAAGNDYSLALLASGSVVAWGRQIDGRTSVPPGLEGVVQVAAGRYHGLALLSNGTCVSWGDARNAPPPQRFAQVSASIGQSLGLRLDGGVEAWGPDAFAVPADVATPAPSPPAPPPASTEGSSAPIGAIVGGVVGGLAAVAGVAGAVVYARKRSQKPVPAPEKGDASAIGGDKGAGTHAKDDSGHPGDLTWGIPPSNGDSAAAYDSYRSAYPASDQTSPPQFQPALPKQAAPAARAWEAPIDAISGARPSFAPASSNAGSSTAFGSSPGSLQSGLGAETLAVPTIASNGGGRSPAVAASSTPAVSTEQQSIPSVPVVTEVARLGSDGAPAADAPHAQQQSKLLVPASDIEIDHSKSLGQGTFGAVYQGRLRGSVRVAVKTLKDTDAAAAAAFAREVRNWEGLVQRNVMPLMAYCLDPPMMVCEIADGGNMRQYLGRAGWDQGLGRKLLSEVAAGMTYLHSAHVLHGDLKSVNVLVDGGRALITDFGLSRVRADNAASATVGGLFGTPGFIAPELMNGKSLRAPADVYAFGMVCYEVVSKGLYPFHNVTNIMALMYQVGVENKRPERPAGVPEAMWALMQACWQPSPEERPKMEAVRDTLEDMV